MTTPSWQLKTPINAIIFDCDGTLSTIEGIDELAKHNEAGETVQSLTSEAMGKLGMNSELYQKRLGLVFPSYNQVVALAQLYFTHQVPDAAEVIKILKRLNKTIFLISAGLYPAVVRFGELLEIPRENIFAVDIKFDSEGKFLDYDRSSPLVNSNGKRTLVTRLKALYPEIVFVGDGLNDFAAHDLVSRFIGYGGAFYREKIAEQCEFYISTLSMATLLPLVLTQQETELLVQSEQQLYQKGMMGLSDKRMVVT